MILIWQPADGRSFWNIHFNVAHISTSPETRETVVAALCCRMASACRARLPQKDSLRPREFRYFAPEPAHVLRAMGPMGYVRQTLAPQLNARGRLDRQAEDGGVRRWCSLASRGVDHIPGSPAFHTSS